MQYLTVAAAALAAIPAVAAAPGACKHYPQVHAPYKEDDFKLYLPLRDEPIAQQWCAARYPVQGREPVVTCTKTVTASKTEYASYPTDVPVDEEPPVTEDPVIEDPVIEDPVIEDPVIEDPVIEDPVIEDPVIEDPVIEDPVIEDPVIEDPVIEDPVVTDPVEGGEPSEEIIEPVEGGETTEPEVVEPIIEKREYQPRVYREFMKRDEDFRKTFCLEYLQATPGQYGPAQKTVTVTSYGTQTKEATYPAGYPTTTPVPDSPTTPSDPTPETPSDPTPEDPTPETPSEPTPETPSDPTLDHSCNPGDDPEVAPSCSEEGAEQACLCFRTTDGSTGYCGNPDADCGPVCTTNEDCGNGEVCVTSQSSGCAENTCTNAEQDAICGNVAAPTRMFTLRKKRGVARK